MDFSVYVSSVQDRLFLALAGLLSALLLDMVMGALFRHHADPRPVMERVVDFVTAPLLRRMNRTGRADTTLLLRGVVVTITASVVFFLLVAVSYRYALQFGQGGAYLTALVAFSTGTIGWFAPMRALVAALASPKAPRPYLALARATYTNLVTLDDAGLIRVAATAAVRSLLFRLAGPVVLFVLFGWQVLAVYWPVLVLAQAAGQDGTSRAFGVVINGVAGLLLLLPSLVIFPVVMLALFFSAGASFFGAIPAMFKIVKWPPLLQGGAPVLLVAYAMRLMLGGPRQDRYGAPVAAPWVGPQGGTARFEARDIGRILYLQAVTLLLLASFMYLLTVLLQISGAMPDVLAHA